MKVDVYDTYAKGNSGETIHFDVLVPDSTEALSALKFAREWLTEIGVSSDNLTQDRCNFCHTENASEEVIQDIQENGYSILQMEGCPQPQ